MPWCGIVADLSSRSSWFIPASSTWVWFFPCAWSTILSSSSLSNLVSPPIEENKPPVDPFFRGFDFCDSILYEGKPLLGPGDLLSEARELLKEKRLPSPMRLKAGLRLGRHAQTSPMLTSTIDQTMTSRKL
jgi:hypothetical protein